MFRYQIRKAMPIHCQRTACRYCGGSCAGNQQRTQPFHFCFQQSGSGCRPICFQGIGADQLCQSGIVMCRCILFRFHLIKENGIASLCQLPGCFTACQSAANDGYLLFILHRLDVHIRIQAFHKSIFRLFRPFGKACCHSWDTFPQPADSRS